MLQIPVPSAPNTAPTVTTDGQLSLGALDPNAAPPTLTISTDVDGTIRSFNRGAERMFGYRAEELVGTAMPAIFHLRQETIAQA